MNDADRKQVIATKSDDAQIVRILFIGNSFTARNDLPRMIRALAGTSEPAHIIETSSIVAGGASLRRHWNGGVALKALHAEPWNFVVLQEQSTLPVKNSLRYHENVRLFANELAKLPARLILYLTWSRKDSPAKQKVLDHSVETIAKEMSADVARVGPAWHIAMQELPDIALYVADGVHPTPAGTYLAALVFCDVLFGTLPQPGAVARTIGLGDRDAEALHRVIEFLGTIR
ncbi:MAG: SGNH/GDSL hydrolase family protein [Casimicrobiaceae bacterium]